MSYTHFTLEERKYLQELLEQGLSFRKIALILGRNHSSVSREVRRNKAPYKPHKKGANKYWYGHWRAHKLYLARRTNKIRCALRADTPEWDYIVAGLHKFWSPEAICGRWHRDFPDRKKLCVSTIYRYIRLGKFPKISEKQHLRRRGKRPYARNTEHSSIKPDRIIPEWPEEICNRLRTGDWEGDTIYGGVGQGYLVSLVDRKHRFLKLGLLRKKTADNTREVIERLLHNLPVNSISFDNGSEFSEFRQMEEHFGAPVYFAEPHKPWQRGTNENTNDIVRFFYPKGFDFGTVTDEEVQLVEDLINNRPRKCLAWKSPAEVFYKCVALG